MKIFKAKKYFDGPDGVYYSLKHEDLLVLQKGDSVTLYSKTKNRIELIPRYYLYSDKIKGQLLAITSHKGIVKIGEL